MHQNPSDGPEAHVLAFITYAPIAGDHVHTHPVHRDLAGMFSVGLVCALPPPPALLVLVIAGLFSVVLVYAPLPPAPVHRALLVRKWCPSFLFL